MFLQVGAYRHAINEAGLSMSKRAIENKAGVPYLYEIEWTINGKLRNPRGNGRDLDLAMERLEEAYAKRGVDISLLHADGRRSHHTILNSTTLGGIRSRVLSYPTTEGGELCTYRGYTISINAKVPILKNAPVYIEFDEQITIAGGGRRWAVKEVNEGPGVRQLVRTNSRCEASQSGRATMLGRYPRYPSPLWPFALQEEFPKVVNLPPSVEGSRTDGTFGLAAMSITWDWSFVWTSRLSGSPHIVAR